MIYDVNGNALTRFYDVNGAEKYQAYDVNGNPLITPSTVFRIMTYNVGSWYTGTTSRVPSDKKTQYYNLQYGTFDNNPADVVLLQEYLSTWCVDDSPASELISPFYSYIQTTRPTTIYQGHAICSNSPINNYAVHPFTSHGGNYPSFESGEVVIGGKTITFVNTHNDYNMTYQSPEITDLLNFINNLGSFVLAGDFNINLRTQNTTDAQYYNNVTRFLDAGYHVGNCDFAWIATYFSTASPTGGKFTDTIITSADITIKNLYAYTEKLTDNLGDKIDHIPLIAELSI